MKRTILLAVLLAAMTTAMGGNNFFALDRVWTKMVGFSYQTAYPYGFSLAGGSFMSVGFGKDGDRYSVSATEYREPTWSMRFGILGYNFDRKVTGWGAITFRPMLVIGFDKTKDYTLNTTTNEWEKEKETYFTLAPTLAVNVYAIHFSVGYEFVPKFTEINGLTFGVGLSIPLTPSSWSAE